jgi:hypothetical protein
MPVVGELRKVELSKLTGHFCGWAGCHAFQDRDLPDGHDLPDGWSWLVVHNTRQLPIRRIGSRREDALVLAKPRWRHDKMLCPEHTQALDALLKRGTGGADPMSSPIAGTA